MQYIVQIVVGLGTIIPLVIELVKYIQRAIKEKNWQQMVNLTLSLMKDAETLFSDGTDRKKWVIERVKESAKTINYDIDDGALSTLIDSITAVTKTVNTTIKTFNDNTK